MKVYGFYKDDLSISTFPSGPAKMKQLAQIKTEFEPAGFMRTDLGFAHIFTLKNIHFYLKQVSGIN